jgi:hypothetical protein
MMKTSPYTSKITKSLPGVSGKASVRIVEPEYFWYPNLLLTRIAFRQEGSSK